MEVILLKDVKKLGKKDEKVVVNDGYAWNYLIPNKLAVQATKRANEILEEQKEKERQEIIALTNKAKELAVTLESITVTLKAKVGKDGKIFGNISTKQVADELLKTYNITINRRKFIDKLSLSAIGYYNLKIELYKGVIGVVKVHVVEETK